METQDIIYLSLMFGIGFIGFLLNIIEVLIRWDFMDFSFGGFMFMLMLCLMPIVGWVIFGGTALRQLNYIFHFWKEDV